MSRTKWIMIMMLVLAVVVTACGAPAATPAPAQPAAPAATVAPAAPAQPAATAALAPAQSAGKKKIGFSVYDMQYGFFQDMEKGTKEAAEAAGYDYVLVDQKRLRVDHGGGHHGSAHPGHRCADHLARQA